MLSCEYPPCFLAVDCAPPSTPAGGVLMQVIPPGTIFSTTTWPTSNSYWQELNLTLLTRIFCQPKYVMVLLTPTTHILQLFSGHPSRELWFLLSLHTQFTIWPPSVGAVGSWHNVVCQSSPAGPCCVLPAHSWPGQGQAGLPPGTWPGGQPGLSHSKTRNPASAGGAAEAGGRGSWGAAETRSRRSWGASEARCGGQPCGSLARTGGAWPGGPCGGCWYCPTCTLLGLLWVSGDRGWKA